MAGQMRPIDAHLGFVGIYKESLGLIRAHPKKLLLLTLVFILPLVFVSNAVNQALKGSLAAEDAYWSSLHAGRNSSKVPVAESASEIAFYYFGGPFSSWPKYFLRPLFGEIEEKEDAEVGHLVVGRGLADYDSSGDYTSDGSGDVQDPNQFAQPPPPDVEDPNQSPQEDPNQFDPPADGQDPNEVPPQPDAEDPNQIPPPSPDAEDPNQFLPPPEDPNQFLPPPEDPNQSSPPVEDQFPPPVEDPNQFPPPVEDPNQFPPPEEDPNQFPPPVEDPNQFPPPVEDPNQFPPPVEDPNEFSPPVDVEDTNQFPPPEDSGLVPPPPDADQVPSPEDSGQFPPPEDVEEPNEGPPAEGPNTQTDTSSFGDSGAPPPPEDYDDNNVEDPQEDPFENGAPPADGDGTGSGEAGGAGDEQPDGSDNNPEDDANANPDNTGTTEDTQESMPSGNSSSSHFALIVFLYVCAFSLLITLTLVSVVSLTEAVAGIYGTKFGVGHIWQPMDFFFGDILRSMPETALRVFGTGAITMTVFFGSLAAILQVFRASSIELQIFMLFLYAVGIIYVTTIWSLAFPLVILERPPTWGVKALIRSFTLLTTAKRVWLALGINLSLFYGGLLINYLTNILARAITGNSGFGWSFLYVLVVSLVMTFVIFISVLVHTVFFCVCKARCDTDRDALQNVKYVALSENTGSLLEEGALKPATTKSYGDELDDI